MTSKAAGAMVVMAMMASAQAHEEQACSCTGLEQAAARALDDDAARAGAAIAELRSHGPEGLDALMRAHQAQVARLRAAASPAELAPLARLRHALDAVAGQRDAFASGLYWYTDLGAAEAAAAREHKLVLSLRLLGRLDEEYSCANSRFFRTVLYPDPAVASYVKDHFVLHWQSVRPAPRATIDFGDGRTLSRTITGNSIHYVLDARGRVRDAIPGMYGPRAFRDALARAVAAPDHAAEARRLGALVRAEGARAGGAIVEAPAAAPSTGAPTAGQAAPLALTKMLVEAPALRAFATEAAPPRGDAVWTRMAALHEGDETLSTEALRLARAKGVAVDEAALRRNVTRDALYDELVLHRLLHEWLQAGAGDGGVDALNARVYAELFLTPGDDPWLGLAPAAAFSAIEGDGEGDAGAGYQTGSRASNAVASAAGSGRAK